LPDGNRANDIARLLIVSRPGNWKEGAFQFAASGKKDKVLGQALRTFRRINNQWGLHSRALEGQQV
jgi:hypothetical protein